MCVDVATPGGAFCAPDHFADYWYWDYSEDQQAEIQVQLQQDAAIIWGALRSSGQDDCALDTLALNYLCTLNTWLSGLNHNAICARLSDEQRNLLARQVQTQLDGLTDGTISVCGSGKNVPAFGLVRSALTPQNVARILAQERMTER